MRRTKSQQRNNFILIKRCWMVEYIGTTRGDSLNNTSEPAYVRVATRLENSSFPSRYDFLRFSRVILTSRKGKNKKKESLFIRILNVPFGSSFVAR